MKCLDWKEKISGYIDGEISPEETRGLEEHLAVCGSCRALERRMRAVGIGVARIETPVSPDFRDNLFARMEAEELLPRRRSLFFYSLRWAAVPLAAAAAFAVFLVAGPDQRHDAGAPQGELPRTAQTAPLQQTPSTGGVRQETARTSPAASGEARTPAAAVTGLSAEEREIVAHLDLFEDPAAVEEPSDVDAIEIFEPSGINKG